MTAIRKLDADSQAGQKSAWEKLSKDFPEAHISNIFSKLGANDRAHALTIGLQRGIIELGMSQE